MGVFQDRLIRCETAMHTMAGEIKQLQQEQRNELARTRALEAISASAPHVVRIECGCACAHSSAPPPPPPFPSLPPPPPPLSLPPPLLPLPSPPLLVPKLETVAETAAQAAPEIVAPATTSAREVEAGPRRRSTEAAKAKAKAAKKNN